MKTVIALLLAASAAFFTPASAQSVSARNGGDSVILMAAPCSEAVQKRIPEAHRPLFFRATAMLKGKPLEACWTVLGPEVLVIFEDGEYAKFPVNVFKQDGV